MRPPRELSFRLLAAAWSVAWLGACATYVPRPIDPVAQAAPYRQRTLDDPALIRWLDSLGVHDEWSSRRLALAAEFIRPQRSRWAAEWRAAEAGVAAAGARTSPGVQSETELAFADPQATSRWVFGLTGLFTVDLGGRRGARLARAEAERAVTASAITEARWTAAGEVYAADLARAVAGRRLVTATTERLAADSVLEAGRSRYAQGVLTGSELARLESEARDALSRELAAGREARAARTALSATLGVSSAALDAITLPEVEPARCPPGTLDTNDIDRQALRTRPELWRAAADYLVAEADLRAEVARATPELELGPGLLFDQGTGKLTFGAGIPAMLFNRNEGPIAVAVARRAAAGVRVREAQDAILAEVDAALGACHAATEAVMAADSTIHAAARRRRLTDAAWSRREVGRFDVALAQLDLVRADRLAMEARAGLDRAALEFEHATGAWGKAADGPWPVAPYTDPVERSAP